MRIRKVNRITILLYLVFIIGLMVTMSIVIKDINTPNSFRFVLGFIMFLLLFGLFYIILVVLNVRKLPEIDIKRRIVKFTGAFVILMLGSWIANYFFYPERLGNWNFGTPLGIAFGITFYDLMFYRRKE